MFIQQKVYLHIRNKYKTEMTTKQSGDAPSVSIISGCTRSWKEHYTADYPLELKATMDDICSQCEFLKNEQLDVYHMALDKLTMKVSDADKKKYMQISQDEKDVHKVPPAKRERLE
jgi:hypothetical protein